MATPGETTTAASSFTEYDDWDGPAGNGPKAVTWEVYSSTRQEIATHVGTLAMATEVTPNVDQQ
jgi:hypothetical protein